MNNELKKSIIGVVIICFLLASILSSIFFAAKIDILQNKIDNKEDDIYFLTVQNTELQQIIDIIESERDFWMDRYYNYEPEIIYQNDTIYIYKNITKLINNSICDVNRDNSVDYKDAFIVYSYINDGLSFVETIFSNNHPNPYEKLYDVNRDRTVNSKDVDFIWEHCD